MCISTPGVMHPGKMGATIAALAQAAVPWEVWASTGGCSASARRAAGYGKDGDTPRDAAHCAVGKQEIKYTM